METEKSKLAQAQEEILEAVITVTQSISSSSAMYGERAENAATVLKLAEAYSLLASAPVRSTGTGVARNAGPK